MLPDDMQSADRHYQSHLVLISPDFGDLKLREFSRDTYGDLWQPAVAGRPGRVIWVNYRTLDVVTGSLDPATGAVTYLPLQPGVPSPFQVGHEWVVAAEEPRVEFGLQAAQLSPPSPSQIPAALRPLRQWWQAFIQRPRRLASAEELELRRTRFGDTAIAIHGDPLQLLPADFSKAARLTARQGSQPYALYALDGQTILITQLVYPRYGLRGRHGLLRFGTLTPPSTDIQWLGHMPLPRDFTDADIHPAWEIHQTDDAWLVGLSGFVNPPPDPLDRESGGQRFWWTRIPFPANWPWRTPTELGPYATQPMPTAAAVH
ncbi:MAG TPA: hypothetical protein VEI97_00545 [bacterium]|nr:hypothetical protein [bacterium]